MDENLQKKTVNKIITNKYKESCVGGDSQQQIFNIKSYLGSSYVRTVVSYNFFCILWQILFKPSIHFYLIYVG